MSELSKWLELKKMNEREIKNEYGILSNKINALSKYHKNIENEDDLDKYGDEFSKCLDSLHNLRMITESKYFKNNVSE